MTSVGRWVSIWGMVPAAGVGRRMGCPKQTLPYGGSTLAGTVARTLLTAGVDGVIVVTRTSLAGALRLPDDPRIVVTTNDDTDSEMIDSIRIGLAALTDEASRNGDVTETGRDAVRSLTSEPSTLSSSLAEPGPSGVLVAPADMPTLSVETCRRCLDAYRADPRRIVIASISGRRGHPIIFPFSLRTSVDRLEGGLSGLPPTCPERVFLVEVDDPGAMCDVDAPADYEELRRQAPGNGMEPA